MKVWQTRSAAAAVSLCEGVGAQPTPASITTLPAVIVRGAPDAYTVPQSSAGSRVSAPTKRILQCAQPC